MILYVLIFVYVVVGVCVCVLCHAICYNHALFFLNRTPCQCYDCLAKGVGYLT